MASVKERIESGDGERYVAVPLLPDKFAQLVERAKRNGRNMGREGAAIICEVLNRSAAAKARRGQSC